MASETFVDRVRTFFATGTFIVFLFPPPPPSRFRWSGTWIVILLVVLLLAGLGFYLAWLG